MGLQPLKKDWFIRIATNKDLGRPDAREKVCSTTWCSLCRTEVSSYLDGDDEVCGECGESEGLGHGRGPDWDDYDDR